MKPATAAAKTMLRNGHVMRATPKLRAEWEHNRFSPIESITVSPAQNPDVDWEMIYDLDSIGLPNRPRNGIAKARFDGNSKLKGAGAYRDIPQSTRFYLPTEVDPFKYFSTTQRTKLVEGWDEGYDFDAPIEITLMYEDLVATNKIVVGFETAYAKPKTFTIEVTTNGTSWITAASTPVIDARGQVTLWRGNSGQWTPSPDYDSVTKILGIRLTVYSMDLPYTHLDVIQLGARLENDLSDFVEGYDRSFEISDRSLIAPLGRASSNTASVSLNNMDRRFNNENTASVYYGLIGKKVKLTLDLSLNVMPTGSDDERIREFTMYSESWGGQDETSVSIELKDSSQFLQEVNVPKVFWENLTVGAIIWQLMDILGLSNYNYTRLAADTGQVIPYFWSEGDKTAWEMFSMLAEATQTAVYFDEWDVMQIRTRRALFGENTNIDWNFDAINAGQKLADIVSMGTEDELVVNKVEVNYKPAKYSDFNNGFPKMETVWEPEEETVTLRACALVKDLMVNNTTEMWIQYNQVAHWPYEATVNIRGEVIRYRGKEYVWRKPGGGLGYEIIYGQEDKERLDVASDPNMRWANAFSGKLAIVERGAAGTIPDTHWVRPDTFTALATNLQNTKFYPIGATQGMNVFDGTVTLVTPVQCGWDDFVLWKHEAVVPSDDTTYGMRFKFPTEQIRGDGGAIGGIWFAGDWGDAGYFLELSTSAAMELEQRAHRHELNLWRMPGNAPGENVWSSYEGNAKGWPANIISDKWYSLDVRHKVRSDGTTAITAFLDGVWAGDWFIDANKRPPTNGKFGVFTRGMARFEIEYLYAVYQENSPEPDESTFFDLKDGGYASGYIDRQWRYGGQYWTVNRGPAHEGSNWFHALNNRANYVLEEFGPVVHEIREFEILFDEDSVPVSHSYPYLSNSAQVLCTNYWADAFGAKFTLVNTARQNAIVQGEDRLTLGENNPIQHKFFVYGRVLYQEDELKHTEEDKQSIRRNGVIDLTFDSAYIQTEQAAKDLGAWVVEQWGQGSDEIKLSVFGNPFIQIGDLVTINYPIKDMYPATHKYYVVSVKNQFGEGLETSLILRRARI